MKSEKKIKRRVGIVGLGNAGSAIAQALLEFVNVEGFDTDPIARKKVF